MEIRKGAEVDLENKLKDDMLAFGSYLPTTLPLEYSKFSNKVLDMRVREHRSAQIRNYDDAQALRNEAIKLERQELDNLSLRFQRSFTLQRQHMLKLQQMQRQSFDVLWKRKQDKYEADLTAELTRLKKTNAKLGYGSRRS